jgi:hypothetical protein
MADPAPSSTAVATANLTSKVEAAVTTAVVKPSTPASVEAIPAIMNELVPVITAIINSSADYPFYKSKVFWSAMLVLIGGILALFNISFSADTQQLVLNIIIAASPLMGVVGVIYGRFFNKKPIGS